MSKVKWTEMQREAINIRNSDTLVSAAAGSGKTAVLVERVIKMLTDSENPIDIDKILVVTFTNAAASQMKEKISEALVSEIEKNPENSHLRNQLVLLGSADIDTVHAFCKNAIKENFHKTDLPFEFEIIQQTENKILMDEALDETFNSFFEDEEKCDDFENFVDSFSGKDDETAAEFILNLYRFLRSMPFYHKWLIMQTSDFNYSDVSETKWWTYIKKYSKKMLSVAKSQNDFAVKILKNKGEEYKLTKYYDTFFSDSCLIKSIEEKLEEGYFSLCDYFTDGGFAYDRLSSKPKDADAYFAEYLKNIRKEYKDIIDDLKGKIFYLTRNDVETMRQGAIAQSKIICDVISKFDELYSAKKTKRGLADFSDLEHKCLDILTENSETGKPSEIALKLKQKYAEVLVDEYQDTNLIQESIVKLVSGEHKKFMVGDIKQSIYRFRNAKPELFLDKYNTYSDTEGLERRILLSKNFRSSKPILGFVNFLFERLMCKECGGLDYTDSEKLYYGGLLDGCDYGTDVYVFDKNDLDKETRYEDVEAEFCAKKIKFMVESGFEVLDNDAWRPCKYSDFTILLRSISSLFETYKLHFAKEGIPLYVDKGDDYFNIPVIKLAVSLFKIIDNPRQDIDLVAVLRSEIFGFTDDDLVSVRLTDKKSDFYTCLEMYESPKKTYFFEKLNKWRKLSETMSVYDLITYIFDECFMYSIYSEYAEVLRTFTDWGKKYSQTSFKGLFRFITYLQKQIESKEDLGSVTMSAGNAVTLMSIHKSKGLENNIVILSNAARKFNFKDRTNRFIMDDYLGVVSDYVDVDNKIQYKSVHKIAATKKFVDESTAEELRLLYVALTRAKQKLIIIGSHKLTEKKVNGLMMMSSIKNERGFLDCAALSFDNYLDWILTALMNHEASSVFDKFGVNNSDREFTDFGVNIEINPKVDAISVNPVKQNEEFDDSDVSLAPLSYQYPYKEAVKVPSKLSVSEIKTKFYSEFVDDDIVYYPKQIDNTLDLIPKPSFLSASGTLTSAMIGTAYHSVLQYFDFINDDTENIEPVLDRLVLKTAITKVERDAIDENVLKIFFKSDIFKSIKSADKVYKEYSFIIPVPSDRLFPGTNEEIMVQGIIDCLYIKDGELYLVDYKSDSYSSTAEIIDKYRTQLLMYSYAVEKRFGKKPISCVLYMLKTGEILGL